MKSDQEKMDLVGRYLAGETTATETSRLEQLMLADEQLRQDFLAYARVDAALPGMINGTGSLLDFAEAPAQTGRSWKGWIPELLPFVRLLPGWHPLPFFRRKLPKLPISQN